MRIDWPLKRVLDVAVGSLLLLLALPLFAAAPSPSASPPPADPLPPDPIGRDRRPFTLWKLRTMAVDAEAESGRCSPQPGDPRLTPIGASLRRFRSTSCRSSQRPPGHDEPVGPRPERPGSSSAHLRTYRAMPSVSPSPRASPASPRSTAIITRARKQAALRAAYMRTGASGSTSRSCCARSRSSSPRGESERRHSEIAMTLTRTLTVE